jgi:hypothetical protein
MQQRYHDPIAGRFLSVDPVTTDAKTGDSFNRYVYGNSNPFKYTDPDGRLAFLAPLVYYVLPAAIVTAGVWAATNSRDHRSSPAASGPKNNGAPNKPNTLTPGPFAGDSIPARGPGRDWTDEERARINGIGNDTGCHTCGAKSPGTSNGDYVPDHQPSSGLNEDGGPQRLYPHCLGCSRSQGGQVRTEQRRRQKEKEQQDKKQEKPKEKKE